MLLIHQLLAAAAFSAAAAAASAATSSSVNTPRPPLCFVGGAGVRHSSDRRRGKSTGRTRGTAGRRANDDGDARRRLRREPSSSSSSSSSLDLFFRKTEDGKKADEKPTPSPVPRRVIEKLQTDDQLTLPYRIALGDEGGGGGDGVVVVRLLRLGDMEDVVDMCVAEYGDDVTLSPLLDPPSVLKWIDAATLRPYVDLIFRLKVPPTLPDGSQQRHERLPEDYAVLVATLLEAAGGEGGREHLQSSTGGAAEEGTRKETIVGMVEVSRQPVVADRNPPPWPVPLALKQLYYTHLKGIELQGWITNLLVRPEHRGRGFAKLLLAVADAWFMTVMKAEQQHHQQQHHQQQHQSTSTTTKNEKRGLSMHLHCDADSVSGKAPQALYKSCGYEETFVLRSGSSSSSNGDAFSSGENDFAWMGPQTLSSSIVMVEGVPLLYLRKKLKGADGS